MITAKYLPVNQSYEFNIMYPDKVQVGDFINGTGGDTYLIDKDKKPILVELFAVTQDGISHGDKVWDDLRKTYWTCSDKFPCNGHIYWKVLGTLSPNATWVKDGDEIEIKGLTTDVIANAIKEKTGIDYKGIDVKCPTCNTYY